jgi:hypothetical protein
VDSRVSQQVSSKQGQVTDKRVKGSKMNSRNRLLMALVAIALVFGATRSFAQFGGSRGGMGGMTGGSRGGGSRDQNKQDNRNNSQTQQAVDSYEQTEYRLQLMEEDIHLQPDQRPLWDSFSSKVRAYASDLARARARERTPPADTGNASGIHFVEQTADSARNRATALDDIAMAAQALYDKLAPTQKVVADARIVTLVAPQVRAGPAQDSATNLPDLGSSGRTQR